MLFRSTRERLGLFGFALCLACQRPAAEGGPAASSRNPEPAPATTKAPVASSGPTAAPSSAPAANDSFSTRLGTLRVDPIHHGTFRLFIGDKIVYVDPTTSERLAWNRNADLVLITDIHADHFDQAALGAIVGPQTQVIAPPVVVEKYPRAQAMKNGETRELLGIGIQALPMYNLERGPAPGKLFHDKGRGNGYLLTLGDTRVYVSGDTECTPEMRALTHIDIAFVTMNLPYTMPPEEAAACVNAFKPKVVYPFHYRDSDLQVFERGVTAPGVEVRLRDWY